MIKFFFFFICYYSVDIIDGLMIGRNGIVCLFLVKRFIFLMKDIDVRGIEMCLEEE